ncbi:hypothetical protein FCM35_KLT04965 [Carex littledalei]|uniref:Uncharacterized protein n=1 Tax=Carex littledalei TaxID=544730 RepID=A0A833QTX4_9POAL|nr:hypothetical protein FCM35_KLT04965 [Carex littledalei]
MVAVSAIAPFYTPPILKIPNYPSQAICVRTSRRNLSLSAQSNGGNGDGVSNRSDGGLDDRRKSPLIDLRRWMDLLSADPENIAAVGLTGLLTWASVQALFQLIFISFAIVLAALKYSFIAALLLFILITLL